MEGYINCIKVLFYFYFLKTLNGYQMYQRKVILPKFKENVLAK